MYKQRVQVRKPLQPGKDVRHQIPPVEWKRRSFSSVQDEPAFHASRSCLKTANFGVDGRAHPVLTFNLLKVREARIPMARRKSSTLTEAELRLMQVIWDKGT